MIKSIQLQTNVDLDNCDQEPIHIPGSIQPHGILLGISQPGFLVTYCSANVEQHFGFKPEELLGKQLSLLLNEESLNSFFAHIQNIQEDQPDPLVLQLGDKGFSVAFHYSNDTLVAEFEPLENQENYSLIDFYYFVRSFRKQIKYVKNLKDICQKIAEETREITGYDRVMVYRFDKDYNGEVFSESKREELEPFLGLHYPHTDIPTQARELYMRNLMRMIADINYTPVPILTLGKTAPEAPLDLGLSVLRSVSPIHVEYLQNMGVGATLVISLISENKLWGLITCHHYSPKNVPYNLRMAAKLQGLFLSSQLAVLERADELDCEIQVNAILNDLVSIVISEENFIEKLLDEEKNLLRLTGSDGVALVINGEFFTKGNVPEPQHLHQLVQWLNTEIDEESFYTDKLADFFPYASQVRETAAGILAYSIGKPDGNYLIWFRQELEKTVNWAGDPKKAVVVEKNGARLSPRKSFELWKQAVRYQSKSWLQCEINAGMKLAGTVQNQVYLRNLREEEKRYRTLSQKLQQMNKELEHFTWISSHDMREPLRMISIYTQMISQKYNDIFDAEGKEALGYVLEGANRMHGLINSVLEYARIGHSDSKAEWINLPQLLSETIVKQDTEIQKTGAQIEIDKENIPQKIFAIYSLLSELFGRLIQNAIKFRSAERKPLIFISATRGEGEWVFSVKDNGIGIKDEYKERIFVILQQLHDRDVYEGTGIGLPIAKKIIEMHGGTIWVESEFEKGSTFYFSLPDPEQNAIKLPSF